MKNQTKKLFKDPITKHIWVAIGILSLGIIIGIGIAILFNETEGVYGITSSIILSFLAVAFSYYQFYLNKFDTERREKENQEQTEKRRLEDQRVTEKRRLNDIKLSAYSQLLTQSHIIIEDCSKILIDINKGYLKENRESKHLFLVLKFKFNRIKEDIDNFNQILKTSISFEELQNVNSQMEALLISHYKQENKTTQEYSEIFTQFVTSIDTFTNRLSIELLK